MDKLGVEQEDEAAKTAKEKPVEECPVCRRKLLSADTHNVLVCPSCGTFPWESTPNER